MNRILLVGATPFFSDHISFLLKLTGFELVLVRNLEEAINRIEINRSLLSDFDLLIMEQSELNDGTGEYFRFVRNMLGQVRILLIGGTEFDNRPVEASLHGVAVENVFYCSIDTLVPAARALLKDETVDGGDPNLSCHL